MFTRFLLIAFLLMFGQGVSLCAPVPDILKTIDPKQPTSPIIESLDDIPIPVRSGQPKPAKESNAVSLLQEKVIRAAVNELDIIAKNMTERQTRRMQKLREYESILKKHEQIVNSLSLVIGTLDSSKIFTMAFYCKLAGSSVNDYREVRPNFEQRMVRINSDIQRLDSIRVELNKNFDENLPEDVRQLTTQAIETCNSLVQKLNTTANNTRRTGKKFEALDIKFEKLSGESKVHLSNLLNKVFNEPSGTSKRIITDPSRTWDRCVKSWDDSSQSKLQFTYDEKTYGWWGWWAMGIPLLAYLLAYPLTRILLKNILKSTHFINKIFAFTNIIAILLMAGILLLVREQVAPAENLLFRSVLSLIAEFFLLCSAVFFSLVTRLEQGVIKAGMRVYTPYLILGGSFMVLRMFTVPNVIVDSLMPVVFTIITLLSMITWARLRAKLPPLDRFFSTISLLIIICGTVISWNGLSFLAFLILMIWTLLMTSILLLVGIWDMLHGYEMRHKAKEAKLNNSVKWFRPFLSKLLLPLMAIWLIIFSFTWPTGIFDMSDIIIDAIYAKIEIEDVITFSWSSMILVVGIGIILNYVIFLIKNMLHDVYGDDFESGGIATIVALVSLALWAIYIFSAFIILHVNYNGLLMIMGGMSMGIGFAMKDTIENLLSGLSLMLGRLRQGDMIECDGYRGRVMTLGYRSTMIETVDGSIIAFQNSQLFNKNFRNMTRNHKFELSKVEVGVTYGCDVERARAVILDAVTTLPFLSKIKKTSVVLDNFGDSSVNLAVFVWVPVLTKVANLSVVRECIYKAFNENGIEIPFPQQDVYVKQFPNAAATTDATPEEKSPDSPSAPNI